MIIKKSVGKINGNKFFAFFILLGLKKEIKLVEQILAISVVIFVVEVIIFAIPYLILPFR